MLHSVMSPSSVCLRIRRLLLPVMDKLLERSLEIIDKYEPRFCPKPVRVVTDDMLETMIFEYLTLLNRFFSDSTSELLHVKFRSNFLSVMYVGARRRPSFPLSPRSRFESSRVFAVFEPSLGAHFALTTSQRATNTDQIL